MFTPHARGSTHMYEIWRSRQRVYPACAGIDPTRSSYGMRRRSLPRMRGDRPSICAWSALEMVFTPHARGSTQEPIPAIVLGCVYPACAGIDRRLPTKCGWLKSLPRMRGDRPFEKKGEKGFTLFTPHARGSTVGICSICSISPVYPACAGIDLQEFHELPFQ